MNTLFFLELLGRMLLLSVVLMAVYMLLLRHRADYRLCRRYLLSIPFLCLLLPLFHIGLAEIRRESRVQEIELTEAEVETYLEQNPQIAAFERVPVVDSPTTAGKKDLRERRIAMALWALPAVSVLLLLVMGVQWLMLFVRCRRMEKRCQADADGIVCCDGVGTPFSFGRRVFLPEGRLTPGGRRLVVMHEQAHIALGHAAEGLLIEFFLRLLWFNPVMWLVRTELRNVHEFEADRRVLDTGADVLTYQTLLLEETMNSSPVFANGFNHSFVRRRFVEMRRNVRWHATGMVTLVLAFLTLGLTGVAAMDYSSGRVVFKILPAETVPQAEEAVAEAEAQLTEEPDVAVSTLQEKSDTLKAVQAPSRPDKAEDGWPIAYNLPHYDNDDGEDVRRLYLYHEDGETYLIFDRSIDSDDELLKNGGPNCYLVDPATGVHYQPRRAIPAQAWNYFHVRGLKGQVVRFALVFPRIPDSVREIALYRISHHLQSDERYPMEEIFGKLIR